MSGIFGLNLDTDCTETLFYGTDYHSHLGTEYGGVAVLGERFYRQIHSISDTQFKSKFFQDCVTMKGNKGVGVISAIDEQPIYINSSLGPFCLVANGLIQNKTKLADGLLKKGGSFSEFCSSGINTAELIAKLISRGETLTQGIIRMSEQVEGSCSVLLLHRDGVYAARDRLGYTPLVIGKSERGWAVATETSALANLGFEVVKYMAPGEIVLLNEKGVTVKHRGNGKCRVCAFLWIYSGFPASCYEGINVEVVRERCGRCLAIRDRQDKDVEVDLVAGMPDSGIAHALGYAMESGKPYRRPLVKYTPGYGRSYTPPVQTKRDLIARMKLIPIEDIIRGNRIVVCEDSIVRGTQLKSFTVKKLWRAGAREIHVRAACPPLMFPCKFCLSTRDISELAARKAIRALEKEDVSDISSYLDYKSARYAGMVNWITRDLEVNSIKYQTIDDMIKAIGLPEDKLCLYCWTGRE